MRLTWLGPLRKSWGTGRKDAGTNAAPQHQMCCTQNVISLPLSEGDCTIPNIEKIEVQVGYG